MTTSTKSVTLRHVIIQGEPKIGIEFRNNRQIEMMLSSLPNLKFDDSQNISYLSNTKENLDNIFNLFRGVVWINMNYFYINKPFNKNARPLSLKAYYQRKKIPGTIYCPEEYIRKLELRKYSIHTARNYIASFEAFLNFNKDQDLIILDERDIRHYLQKLVHENKSDSSINMAINAIKFYYEIVLNMPQRFYHIERPRQKEKLPTVISILEAKRIINATSNIKHKCMLSLLYSAGLRRSELINLELTDIESERMLIKVRQGKGNKDRYTLLSKSVLKDLRAYYLNDKPKKYLFEGSRGGKYSSASVRNVLKRASLKVLKNRYITPHTLRHSFATLA